MNTVENGAERVEIKNRASAASDKPDRPQRFVVPERGEAKAQSPANTNGFDREQHFNRLFAVHRDDVMRLAFRLSGNRSLAEDLVQEALIRAWKSIDGLQDARAAKGWLLTIRRREIARHFGRKRLQETGVPTEAVAAERRDYDTSTEAFALRRALDRLPPDYREPLLMRVIHGYSLKETADHLGISSAGAGTRVFRARARMRALL